ncbi:MAG: GHKL domain-containing protein [Treponema sp.]|nr:GHKL domain-containing protein [Treponema sp.]
MIRTVIEFSRYFMMILFPTAVAFSFAGMERTRKNILVLWCFTGILFIFVLVNIWFWKDMYIVTRIFPLLCHVPTVVFIVVYFKRPPLIALTSLFLTFLCYQVPRWIGSFSGEIFTIIAKNSGGVSEGVSVNSGIEGEVFSFNHSGVLNAVSMNHLGLITGAFLTIYFLQKYAVRPVRRLMNRSVKSCLFFGALPFAYYLFDYAVVIYTDLMYTGHRAVVQFMPSFVSAAYVVFTLLYYVETQKQARVERERDMLDMQFRLAQTEFDSLRQIQENAAHYRHDMRHHFALLQGLASKGEGAIIERIKEYLRTAESDMDAITPLRFCENETVNLILSAFAVKAQQSQTLLTIDAKLPESIPFSDTELCSLLSNALENAIAACERIPEINQRFVRLRIHSRDDKLCIDIRNRYQKEPVFEHGQPVTTEQGHGFGTKSMARIVEKHNGVFQFSVKDGWFVFQAAV